MTLRIILEQLYHVLQWEDNHYCYLASEAYSVLDVGLEVLLEPVSNGIWDQAFCPL